MSKFTVDSPAFPAHDDIGGASFSSHLKEACVKLVLRVGLE